MRRTVAIIEPDQASATQMREALESAGFRTNSFADGPSALSTLRDRPVAVAILDLAVGLDVCAELSRLFPVVTVASDADEESCVGALDAGADDCVCRNVPKRELVARIHNVLRRCSSGPVQHEFDGLSVAPGEMRVREGERVHELSRGEAELLAVLLEYAPRPLTKAQLGTLLNTRRATIESRIKGLRKKIGSHRLVTQGHFGYHLRMDG
jgi:DNA-binding response OmpR family regulator